MPAIKSLTRGNEPDLVIKMLIKLKRSFDLYASNYQLKIILDDGQIFSFTKHEQSRATFAAFSKLKSDLQKIKLPNIGPEDVTYFQHDFKEPIYVEKVCNIDLKSCYANVLFLDKMISKDTHKYLSKLVKKDRLSAVGMLASKKEIIEFKNGKANAEREERSITAPFFFYAVKRTFEIMADLKRICGPAYLFTWVDGIYFLPDPEVRRKCEKYLHDIKFPYSKENLSEFEVKFTQNAVKVSFLKQGCDRRKRFDLPTAETKFKRFLSDTLLSINRKKPKSRI